MFEAARYIVTMANELYNRHVPLFRKCNTVSRLWNIFEYEFQHCELASLAVLVPQQKAVVVLYHARCMLAAVNAVVEHVSIRCDIRAPAQVIKSIKVDIGCVADLLRQMTTQCWTLIAGIE